jgi:nicotinamide-nucleotide amidase
VKARRAEIIAVGSELLTSAKIDTNSLYITARLNEIGIAVVAKAVLPDDRAELASSLRLAAARSDVVVVTGGLGPTDDDLTRESAADALGLELDEDAAILQAIRARFESRGLTMPEINRKQARVPRGASVFPNRRGTAPGLWIDSPGGRLLLVPGPPGEMRPIVDEWCTREGHALSGGMCLLTRVLKVANRTESHVEEIAQPVYARWRDTAVPISTTILAAPGQIELHLTATAASRDEAGAALAEAVEELAARLGVDVFTTTGQSLEEVVGAQLLARGATIAIGESCTGGLIASRLTDVSGSSAYVLAGIVAYSNAAKATALDVPSSLIDAYGAVSEPVALAMADGARQRHGASIGIGVTGIAGPGGGTPDKPVGTVAVAVSADAAPVRVRTYRFLGGRTQVKFQASQVALDQVRRLLMEP